MRKALPLSPIPSLHEAPLETVDAVVIGAGVIGLAVARQLAQAGREVLILEAETRLGAHTSARNSEVIHAGLYYPTDSLKARCCVRGKELLYRYCAEHGVAHRRIGKLLIAVEESECAALAGYARQAAANGVPLRLLTAGAIRRLEPAVRAVAGLYSAGTGIIDSHGLMLALLADAERAGAILATHTRVTNIRLESGGIVLRTDDADNADEFALRCRYLVNAAGLWAQDLARRMQGLPPQGIPPCFYAKGHYFTFSGPAPFQRLVYPIPDAGGLGIHATLDLAGQCKFGPDVSSWPTTPDYRFESGLEAKFYQAIRRYYPDLPDRALQPGYTGIRPKLTGPGAAAGDFMVQGPQSHGIPGLVNLFGIESPGLTACLALAEQAVAALAR